MISLKNVICHPVLSELQLVESFGETYSDLWIKGSNGNRVPTQRFILGSVSPYLSLVLRDVPPSSDACLLVPDTSEESIRLLLEFLHTDQLRCSQNNYFGLLELMQLLEIDFINKCSVNIEIPKLFANEHFWSPNSAYGAILSEAGIMYVVGGAGAGAAPGASTAATGVPGAAAAAGDNKQPQQQQMGELNEEPKSYVVQDRALPPPYVQGVAPTAADGSAPAAGAAIKQEPGASAVKTNGYEVKPTTMNHMSGGAHNRDSMLSDSNSNLIMHPCQICDSCFTSNAELDEHVRHAHIAPAPQASTVGVGDGAGVTLLKCGLCNSFTSEHRDALERHIVEQHSSYIAGLDTLTPQQQQQMGGGADGDVFEKDASSRAGVGAGAAANGPLNESNIDDGNKRHQCDICFKRFSVRHSLTRHRSVVHMQLKPHSCQFCDKKFGTKEVLIRHVRTHTGEKPFVCTHCFKSFAGRQPMKVHMQRAHPEGGGGVGDGSMGLGEGGDGSTSMITADDSCNNNNNYNINNQLENNSSSSMDNSNTNVDSAATATGVTTTTTTTPTTTTCSDEKPPTATSAGANETAAVPNDERTASSVDEKVDHSSSAKQQPNATAVTSTSKQTVHVSAAPATSI